MNSRFLKYKGSYKQKGICCISFDVIAAVFVTDASVGAIAAGVAAVGTDLAVVGAVTGNKTLTEIGGVMGLAGGIVGLASGMIGGATSAVGADSSISSALSDADVAGGLNPAINPDPSSLSPNGFNADGSVATPSASSALANADTAATTNAATGAASSLNGGPSINPQTGTASANDIGATQNGLGSSPTTPNTPGQPLPTNAPAVNPADTSGNVGYNLPKTPPADTSPFGVNTWLNGLDPITRHAVIMAAGQGVASMVGGLFNSWTQSQKLALAQQAQNLAQTQYTNAIKAANIPTSVGAYVPPVANPAAPPQNMAGTGLLNSVQASNT